MPLKLGLFSMTTGPCAYPDGAARVGARRRGGRLRVALGGRSRRAARSAGARPADGARRCASLDPIVALTFLAAHTTPHPARHRGHHPAAAQAAGPRQAARLARRALERPAHLRRWASAGASRSCARSAPRSRSAAASPTTTWPRCARCGRSRSPRYHGRLRGVRGRAGACPGRCRRRSADRGRRPHRRRPFAARSSQGHGWYGFGLDVAGRPAAGRRRYGRPPASRQAAGRAGPARDQRHPARDGSTAAADPRRFAALGVHRLILIPPRSADAAGLEQFVAGIGYGPGRKRLTSDRLV